MTTETEVRELPLICTGESVRSILADEKTQTRRVVTDRNSIGNFKASQLDLAKAWVDPGPSPAGNMGPYLKAPPLPRGPEYFDDIIERLYPRMWPGDRFWVRETFHWLDMRPEILDHARAPRPIAPCPVSVGYRADDGHQNCVCPPDEWRESMDNDHIRWRSPIHMPRWASRILLEITEVRVERLQAISESDAEAEGVYQESDLDPFDISARWLFCQIWNRLNARRGFGWDVNPWVLALTFKRVT